MLPRRQVLSQVLAATVARYPEHEAFVLGNDRVSWEQMHERTLRMAALLYKQGVRRGDHVGIMLGNSAQWLESFYACGLLGAVTVPINTRFRTEELAFCLKQADISVLISTDTFLGIDFLAMLSEVEPAIAQGPLPGERLPCLRSLLLLGANTIPAGAQAAEPLLAQLSAEDLRLSQQEQSTISPDDILLIQYTSGTTSFPKGVMLSHDNMLSNAWAVALRMGVRADDRYFSIRPFFHVAGTTLSILVSLSTGCCLLSLPRFDVEQTLTILDEEKCTLTSGNDTIFLMLLGHEKFDRQRLHLRGGWAAAGPEVMQKIHDEMGVQALCNAYGLSEASPNVALSSWDDDLHLRVHGWALPHEGVQVRITDPEGGQLLVAGQAGEIQIKGWSVMRAYYNMPEQTAQTFTADGWLRTGDLGVLDDEGRLRMVGRLKDMFRVGGENVAPTEVEGVILLHDAIELAQVVGVPDARLGEVPAVFVVLKKGRQLEPEDLIAWCKARIANFKVPRFVKVVDSFEFIGMTGSSKIQKNKLQAYAIEYFGLN